MSQSIPTMVPMQVLMDIDNSRNPMTLTKDRLERAATENQFMNGKIHAIDVRVCSFFSIYGRGPWRGSGPKEWVQELTTAGSRVYSRTEGR